MRVYEQPFYGALLIASSKGRPCRIAGLPIKHVTNGALAVTPPPWHILSYQQRLQIDGSARFDLLLKYLHGQIKSAHACTRLQLPRLAVSLVVGVDVLRVAGVGGREQRSLCELCLLANRAIAVIHRVGKEHTVDAIVLGRVPDNGVAAAGRKAVLAVDLVLAAIDLVGAGPNVNVRLAILIVGVYDDVSILSRGCQNTASNIKLTTLGAVVLYATVLGQEGQVDNLALVKLAGRRGDGDGVVIGTGT